MAIDISNLLGLDFPQRNGVVNKMNGYFGIKSGVNSVPHDATIMGLTINNRQLKRTMDDELGLRYHLIPFQYIEEVPSKEHQANYDKVDVPMRFESIIKYKNSSTSNFNIKLTYYAEGSKKRGHSTFWSVENIERIVARLRSLTFPDYDSKQRIPDLCLLNIGDQFINYPVKVIGVNVHPKEPFIPDTMQSMNYDVDVQFESQYPLYQAISASDIRTYKTNNGVFAYKEFNSNKVK